MRSAGEGKGGVAAGSRCRRKCEVRERERRATGMRLDWSSFQIDAPAIPILHSTLLAQSRQSVVTVATACTTTAHSADGPQRRVVSVLSECAL